MRVGAAAVQIRVLPQLEYHAQFWSSHCKSIKLNWKNSEEDTREDQGYRPVSVW